MTNRQVSVLKKTRAVVAAILLLLLLCVQVKAVSISVRPNTRMEFASLRCRGEFDKKEYSALTRVCEDCDNLFRSRYVYASCNSNCFRNSLFPACVSSLLLDDQMEDFSRRIAVASGDH